MESRIVTTFDEFLKLQAPWQELHRSADGWLFQRHDWLTAWWKVYGTSRNLRLYTFWNDALLVGVIPLFWETKRTGPMSFRRMSLLGEEEVYGEYFPMVETGSLEEVTQSAASLCVHELRRGDVDVIDFHGFPPDADVMVKFVDWLSVGAHVRYIRENKPHFVIEGATSGEDYLKKISYRRRRSLKRQQRLLLEAGAEIEMVREWDAGKPFDDLVRLHTLRWTHAGQPGRFGSAKFTEFLRTVTERLMADGAARMYFVRFRDERICGTLDFHLGRRAYSYLVGRDPAHELMRFSVGEVLGLRGTMDAFNEGIVSFDLMGGDYQHKHYQGITKSWYARATAVAPGMQGTKGYIYWGGLAMRDALARARRIQPPAWSGGRREQEKS